MTANCSPALRGAPRSGEGLNRGVPRWPQAGGVQKHQHWLCQPAQPMLFYAIIQLLHCPRGAVGLPTEGREGSHDLLLLILSNVQPFSFHLSVHLICPSRRSLPAVFTFHLSPFTLQNSVLYTPKSDIRGEFVKKNGKKLTNIQKLIIFATTRWGMPLKETIHKNGATPIFIEDLNL